MNHTNSIRLQPIDECKTEEGKEQSTIAYAMIMWKLQELCGLTYREARAHLVYYRETIEGLSKDLNISQAAARKLRSRAACKIADSYYTWQQIAGKYNMTAWHTIGVKDFVFDQAEMEAADLEKK
ncbi:MAG: hypothetical protein LBH69_03285 [Methanomassiliicoccaceae archaeon]|jgi:hypothetical protein|nr:hypothetical protein [Methanomassiliicoccaceae archaeon]